MDAQQTFDNEYVNKVKGVVERGAKLSQSGKVKCMIMSWSEVETHLTWMSLTFS